MLENGFGEHNIQGIGDKHIPLIHNVMNTDVVVRGQRPRHRRARRAVQHRRRPGATSPTAGACRATSLDALAHFGLSSICNVLGRDQDGQAARPRARRRHRHRRHRRRRACTAASGPRRMAARLRRRFDEVDAAEVVRRAPRSAPTPTTCSSCTERRSQADLQPRLLHLGRAAGRAVRAVRGPRDQRFWRGLRGRAGGGTS